MLTGGIQCLHDDAWLYDLVWFASLYWLLMYCGSSTYNDISCLAGFFCTSHLLLVILRHSTQSFRGCPERSSWQHSSTMINKWKQAEVKNILFLFLPPCPSPLHLISFNNHDHNQLHEDDIMNFTMLFNLPYQTRSIESEGSMLSLDGIPLLGTLDRPWKLRGTSRTPHSRVACMTCPCSP